MRAFAALFAFAALVSTPVSATPTPFAGIFEISQDGAGRVTEFKAVGVVDARTGRTKPEPIAFPKAYLDAVRSHVERHLKPGVPSHYFTYFPYDPADPTNLGTPED